MEILGQEFLSNPFPNGVFRGAHPWNAAQHSYGILHIEDDSDYVMLG
jgi:hypothetical protein